MLLPAADVGGPRVGALGQNWFLTGRSCCPASLVLGSIQTAQADAALTSLRWRSCSVRLLQESHLAYVEVCGSMVHSRWSEARRSGVTPSLRVEDDPADWQDPIPHDGPGYDSI